MNTETTFPRDYYWAAEDPENLDDLVGYLNDKTNLFYRALKGTNFAARIARNFRYYHNLFYGTDNEDLDLELKQFGQEGEYLGLAIPQFRSLLQHIMTLVTQNRPAWDTKAINTDPESIQQARLGNHLLDAYMTFRHVEDNLKRAVEHALIFNVGYTWTFWDPNIGPSVGQEMEGQRRAGDVQYRNPYVYDVIYDLSAREWSEVQWVRIRTRENKWDVVARYPELKEEILLEDDQRDEEFTYDRRVNTEIRADKVDVWRFYHRVSPAMPYGRYLESVGDLPLIDMDFNEEELPIDRVVAGEQILSCLGYSPANDIQALNETINAEASTIATNHKTLGLVNLWLETGSNLSHKQLDGGLNIIFSDAKPEIMTGALTPPEVQKFAEQCGRWMEEVTGINSVSRGQPEANLRSGTALALIDAKAQQATSYLQAQYYQHLEGVGTKTLKLLRKFGGDSPRTVAMVGKFNRAYLDQFIAADLDRIDRVIVQSGNPLMNSISGRVQIADNLLQRGMISTPEEYINLLNTGQLESMLEAESSELAIIREENARLLAGETLRASPIDNHVLHIREHHSILGSTKMRSMNQVASNALGHLMEHMQLLKNPFVQQWQVVLGYRVPIPPAMPPEAGQGPLSGNGKEPPSQKKPQGEGPPLEGSGNPTGRPEAQARPPQPPRVPTQAHVPA